jgi:putative transcriptional regulator
MGRRERIVTRTAGEARAEGRIDKARLLATTDEEIERQIAEDPDTAPMLSDEKLGRARMVYPVRAIRERLAMSQATFARLFGISVDTLQNWEQGRRQPEGPARMLLRVIDREPEAVRRALREPEAA